MKDKLSTKDKLLIVDDNPKNLQVLGKTLNTQNYEVEFALDGNTALEWLVDRKFDLVLLDINMPGISGFEVCQKIRENSKLDRMPIIFLSAAVDRESIIKGFDAGAQDYVTKPFDGRELIMRVKTQLALKKSQEELAELNQTLEEKVERRTRQLNEAKEDVLQRMKLEESLKKSIEKEKELNELKSRFVSMASHEFRTPLASILLSAETLLAYWKKMSEEQILEKINNIKGKVTHLTDIVTNVLQVSKIHGGRINFQPSSLNLVTLCNDVIKDFNDNPVLKNKISFKCEFDILEMMLDRQLILQILHNLISNAIKYAQPNPIVNIKLYEEEDNLVLSIKDNGVGIPENDQKNLFQPFFRAGNVRNIDGNGLGLNIVREAINMHGGEIKFESKVDEGSIFYVLFPKKIILTNLVKQDENNTNN